VDAETWVTLKLCGRCLDFERVEARGDWLTMERGDDGQGDGRLRHEAPPVMGGAGTPIIQTVLLIVNQPGE